LLLKVRFPKTMADGGEKKPSFLDEHLRDVETDILELFSVVFSRVIMAGLKDRWQNIKK